MHSAIVCASQIIGVVMLPRQNAGQCASVELMIRDLNCRPWLALREDLEIKVGLI